MGKSELTAAIALLLTCGDGEERAEVYGCVHILAEAVASPLLHLYQERAGTTGGKEHATAHPLYQALHDEPNSEMTPTTVVQWPALLAWVETGCYVVGGDNLPSASDFEERYCGCWESFTDYAAQLAEDIDLIDGWYEEAQRYFNWEAWTHDLKFDYTVADAPDGGVFIYRSF